MRYTWPKKNRHKERRQKEHNIIETITTKKKSHATLNNGEAIEILDTYTDSLADLEIF